jgi:CRISPR-associated endonuclease Cas2
MKISKTLNTLLDILGDANYVLSRGTTSLGYMTTVVDLKRIDDAKERRRVYQRMKDLERRKVIALKREGQRIIMDLNQDGYVLSLKAKILSCEKELPDYAACLVVFDLPEDMKNLRTEFRSLLKRAGFYMVQRSVWEITKDVICPLEDLVDELKLQQYILVYRVMRKLH